MPQKTEEELVADAVAVVTETVEQDHSEPKKFRVRDFIRNGGIKMPETKVDIFTDVDAGYQYDSAKAELDGLLNSYAKSMTGPPPEELEPLQELVKELADRIWDSRMIFHLRGLAPALVKAITKKGEAKDKEAAENGEPVGPSDHLWSDIEMLRKTVQAVEIPALGETELWGDGDKDIDHDYVKGVLNGLYLPESEKLMSMASVLALGVTLADRRADAGFLGGSAEPDGESGDPVPAEDSDRAGTITG